MPEEEREVEALFDKVIALTFGVALGLFFAVVILLTVRVVGAHHQGATFPIPREYFVLMDQLERDGGSAWYYEQRCSNGGIYYDIQGALIDTLFRFNIDIPEIAGQGWRNVSTCGADFVGHCGAEATACVGSEGAGFPINCDAFYDGPYMATFWSFASRKSVAKHEYMHCYAMRAEDYDDDRTDGTNWLRCIPSISIMGCGPNHPNDYSDFDVRVWEEVHYPGLTGGTLFAGTYSGESGLFNSTLVYGYSDKRAKRVAVFFENERGFYWAGIHLNVQYGGNLPVANIPVPPRTNVYVAAENGMRATWGGRGGATMSYAGSTP